MRLHALLSLASAAAFAQTPPAPARNSLATMSAEIRALTTRVARSVVEIEVTSYSAAADDGKTGALSRQQGLGSGVIIDPNGYIVTNAHVVTGAIDLKVLVNTRRRRGGEEWTPRSVDGRILGLDRESDLALLKIEETNLPALPFAPIASLQQGDLVLAIGNPMGLRNSVSLGVVSSTARPLSDTSPLSYIQTDAAINPGNSGGALVDAEGRLVGINTFILSRSGGSEGLGFAIPANIVQEVAAQLKEKGHVDRGEIGTLLEDITPALKAGLSLDTAAGIIVADVVPDSPAEQAGLRIGDILLSVNGRRVESVSRFRSYAYFKKPGEKLVVELQRGEDRQRVEVVTRARPSHYDPLAPLGSPDKYVVPRLGILGIEIDQELAKLMPPLREASGVIVAARTGDGAGQSVDLQVGDVIHAFNGTPVATLDYLRSAVDALKPGAAVALQVEREGRMQFVAFLVE